LRARAVQERVLMERERGFLEAEPKEGRGKREERLEARWAEDVL